jgi:hypothetical protein
MDERHTGFLQGSAFYLAFSHIGMVAHIDRIERFRTALPNCCVARQFMGGGGLQQFERLSKRRRGSMRGVREANEAN